MARKKHTVEQIIGKLREAEVQLGQGLTVGDVCRSLGITEQTYYRWRKEWGGLKLDQAKRLKELEREKQEKLGVSERRACRVLGQPRSTQRYRVRLADDEAIVTAAIVALARQYVRYGYRTIWAMLRQLGWRVNHKRVERIWRREGLKIPKKQPKRGRLWLDDGSVVRLRPCWKVHIWAYDFVRARTHDGKAFRMLTVIDEYSRACLAILVARRLRSDDVLHLLTELFVEHGAPDHIRSDNGSEFTATEVRKWLARVGVKTLFITPGSPWENVYNESFNGRLRNEVLNGEIFYSLREAQVLIESWRRYYNTVRPHSSLGYRPPAPEAITSRWPDPASVIGGPRPDRAFRSTEVGLT
jgi:transposase InsO family protein